MNKFWNNIFRYPRFFISSLAGSILIILTPAQNLFKAPKFRIGLTCITLLMGALFYGVLLNMVGL